MPDTIEGIWTELHRHYSELESAVTAKQFTAIHPQAVAIKGLTAKLVEIVHPDHKASVQGGIDKINRAMDDLHKAADAEDEAGAKQNLKELDTALKQLEEQMKKQ